MLTLMLFGLLVLLLPVIMLNISTNEESSGPQVLLWGLTTGAWLMLAFILFCIGIASPDTPDFEKNIGKDTSSVYGFKKADGTTYLQFNYHGTTYKMVTPLEERK